MTIQMKWLPVSAIFLLSLVHFGNRLSAEERTNRNHQPFQNGVVAADHPLASQAGIEILQRGGNVVDAAVATSFALSVLRPESGGIGGGGFMVIWDAERDRSIVIDYRERAPGKSMPDMFVPKDAGRQAIQSNKREHTRLQSRFGGMAVAVPGNVAGLCLAVEQYGKLELADVLAPAIRLAEQGSLPDAQSISATNSTIRQVDSLPNGRERFAVLRRLYLNDGNELKPQKPRTSPQASVLRRIAKLGRAGFYEGPVAKSIVKTVQQQGGILTLDDLKEYEPTIRKALTGKFENRMIITMPPPSSGGVALLQTLNILKAYGNNHPRYRLKCLSHNSSDYIHLTTEAMKHAFADRARYLGDTDFVSVPIDRLLSDKHARAAAARIDLCRTQPIKSYGNFLPREDAGTSHLAVIDARGNAVSCTETINMVFGSLVVDPEFGIVLNNEMDDFAAVLGEPNAFGLIQSQANAVAADKRPLSSMTPTILVQNGKAVAAMGASGGPRIISSTLQVMLNIALFDKRPQEAVAAPRFHHQWLPDVLWLEKELLRMQADTLRNRSHNVRLRDKLSACQAVLRTNEGLWGGSDPRKHGEPGGY